MKELALMILLLGVAPFCREAFAQDEVSWSDQAEHSLDRDEQSGIPAGLMEELQDLLIHPLNLNTATAGEMEDAGIFTSFQIHTIIEYRERYGDLISIYELASLRGFRPGRLEEISRYITVSPGHGTMRKQQGTNSILLYAGRSFPRAAGYQVLQQGASSPNYAGSPWKTSLRVKMGKRKGLSGGLVYEKDPGEKGFTGIRPEYLGGFIQYSGSGTLEQCILGSFRLHSGLGLVQGTEQFTAPGVSQSRLLRLSIMKPYAGTSETGSHQGLACRLRLKPVKLTFWASLKSMDMSSGNIGESGLHRTSTEIGGRGLGYQGNVGIQAGITHKKLFTGAQFSTEGRGLTKNGADSLRSDTHPTLHHSASMFWKWQPGKFETFGEYAPGRSGASAFLSGISYHLSDFLRGGILAHWYGPAHRETFSSAYGSGAKASNEKGLMLHLHAEPARVCKADVAVELFWYPAPRSMTSVASSGIRLNLSLESSGSELFSWRIRIQKKIWQATPTHDLPGYPPLVQSNLSRIDGRLILQASKNIQWQTRLVTNWQMPLKSTLGYAALLQFRLHLLKSLHIKSQFVVFNIPSWEQRMYLYEPGLYQHFSFPVYTGRGQKLSLVCTLKSGGRVSLEGKFSMLVYDDRKETGSGNNLLKGNQKSEMGIQLRLKL